MSLNLKFLSKLFHISVGKLIALIREISISYSLKKNKNGIYQVTPLPTYISQLASANHFKIVGFYQPIHDLAAAKRFGANSLEDFSHWAWRSCGIVAVQMVLKTQLGKKFTKTTMELIEETLKQGGYETDSDLGWYHQSLVNLAKTYGIQSWTEKFVPASLIAKHILANRYVLSSIVGEKGGHLLLIYGVRIENGSIKSFFAHDPNDFKEKGDSKEILKDKFEQLSTRRVIILKSKKKS